MKYVWAESDVFAGRKFSIEGAIFMIVANEEHAYGIVSMKGREITSRNFKTQTADWLTLNHATPCDGKEKMKILFTENDITAGLTVEGDIKNHKHVIIKDKFIKGFVLVDVFTNTTVSKWLNKQQMAHYLNQNKFKLVRIEQ